MEQITTQIINEFVKNHKLTFISTHPKLCTPIINRICKKMLAGIKFDDIKTCDNLIIDGHHRYVSSIITKTKIGSVPSHKTSATQEFAWADVTFDENDWDTQSKILHLNEQDAHFNGIDIEILKRITSI